MSRKISWKTYVPDPKVLPAVMLIGAIGAAIFLGISPKLFSIISEKSASLRNRALPPKTGA